VADYIRFDERALDELFGSPRGDAGKYLAKLCIRVESRAKRGMSPGGSGKKHVPSAPGSPPAVDTGRLRASITHELGDDSGDLVGRVGTNVTYAKHLELGTSEMAARPFLRPALDAVRGGL